MVLLACGMTDAGLLREANEDNFCADESLGLFAVADGMGGHAAGDIASTMAVDVLRDSVGRGGAASLDSGYDGNYSELANRLAQGVRSANRVIHDSARENSSWHNMGTTLSAILSEDHRVGIAHVGDSRVYLIRGNAITQLTEDHSMVGEQVRQGLMSRDEAERSAVRNIITRALGMEPEVEVDMADLEPKDGDRLLLCTDGLHTMVPEGAILDAVSSAPDPDTACRRLIDAALEGGGKDNIAVVVVCIYKKKWDAYRKRLQRWVRR